MQARKLITTGHLWVGLVAAPVLIVVGTTGALLTLEQPITDRLDAALAVSPASGPRRSLEDMRARALRSDPGGALRFVQLPAAARQPAALVVQSSAGGLATILIDPYTTRVLGTDADQSRLFLGVRQLHRRLLAGPGGSIVVVAAAIALVLLAATGPFVWWPRRRVGVRWSAGGWRRLLDVHSLLGALSWAFLLAFGITGVIVHWDEGAQRLLGLMTGTTAPRVEAPGALTSCDPSASLALDSIVTTAAAAMPGARPTALMLPERADAPARVSLRYPEDRTPNGRSIVLVDRCTGAVAFSVSTRTAPLAYLLPREWNREIHTGDIFGWPSRVLALLFSLSLPVMAITGPLVWFRRRRRAARTHARGIGRESGGGRKAA